MPDLDARMNEGEGGTPETSAERRGGEPGRGLRYGLLALAVVVLALAGYAGYELYPRFDLPAAEGAGLFLLAAGAGIASFFSPCVFPLLVTLLGRETGARRARSTADGNATRPAAAPAGSPLGRSLRVGTALSLGAAVFLLLAGLGIALGGGALFREVTFTSVAGRILRAVVGGMLIVLGLVQLGVLPSPLHAVESLARPLLGRQAELRRRRPTAGFVLFGFGYLVAGFG